MPAGDPLRTSGLPYWPYDPALRFDVAVTPPVRDELRTLDSASDGLIRMRLVGHVVLPDLGIGLDVWWLDQYAGGLFLPLRDGTAGTASYGGGRYLLDTAKGADLGSTERADGTWLTIDLNFLYHPSCRYNDAWECPLAPDGNTICLDELKDRVSIKGTTDWKQYEITAKVPAAPGVLHIDPGFNLFGNGKIWIDDLKYELIPEDDSHL